MLPVVCMKLEVTGVVGHCLCRVTADTQQLWVRAASQKKTLIFDRLLRSAVVSLTELGTPRVL